MLVDFIFQINKAVGTFEDKNQDHLAKNLRNIIISKPHLIDHTLTQTSDETTSYNQCDKLILVPQMNILDMQGHVSIQRRQRNMGKNVRRHQSCVNTIDATRRDYQYKFLSYITDSRSLMHFRFQGLKNGMRLHEYSSPIVR